MMRNHRVANCLIETWLFQAFLDENNMTLANFSVAVSPFVCQPPACARLTRLVCAPQSGHPAGLSFVTSSLSH